ncbi:LysR family transcriptional regulator [Shewanella gaetbuli]
MLTRSDDLDILLSVVDCGSFSAAAETLNIQVAKASRSVSRIESQLGVSLFNRTTRRIEVTEEGKQFIKAVRDGLYIIKQAEEALLLQKDVPKGRLRVDAASPFVLHQLVPLVKSFNQAYPHIELELSSNEGIVDLLEKRTDVAIRIGQLRDSTLHATSLGKSALYIVASAQYLAQHGKPQTVADLAQHQLVGFVAPKVLNEWPLANFAPIQPNIAVSSGETIRQLVLQGNGIGCLSGFMVKKDIVSGALVPLFEDEKLTNTGREQISAVYYKSSVLSKRISAFVDFIQTRLTL